VGRRGGIHPFGRNIYPKMNGPRPKAGPLFRRRIVVVIAVLLAGGAVLIVRLAQIQIAWHDALSRKDPARKRSERLLDALRGRILTRDGVVLAQDTVAFDISVHYRRLQDHDWQQQLGELCGVPVADIRERSDRIVARVERICRAVKARKPWVTRVVEQTQYHPVVRDVGLEVAALVRCCPERFPDFRVTQRSARVYPNGALAPHVVGQMAVLNSLPRLWEDLKARDMTWTNPRPMPEAVGRYLPDDSIGVTGIEKSHEHHLRGRRGLVEKRFIFKTLRIEECSQTTVPVPGLDVYLTLRSDFQRAANEALEWAASEPALDFDRGALVIMDVRDGSILAAATYPSYDLGSYRKEYGELSRDERCPLIFRPTQAALPIGSVYKLVTATAGLEEGKIERSTVLECRGFKVFGGRPFRCTARWGHGRIDLTQAIEHSCNVYFFQVAERLSGETLGLWGRYFGLGQKTGVDIPYERAGYIPSPRSLWGTLNLCIGQGELLCTPLQVVRMVAAIANGGELVKPHFFHHAERADGSVEAFRPESERVPASAETLRIIRTGMRKVVQTGTARNSGLDRFQAAGKTGTAELTTDTNHAWFAGFAPYDDPRIAFAVVNERTCGHGGSHAAPIVAEALRRVPPEAIGLPRLDSPSAQ